MQILVFAIALTVWLISLCLPAVFDCTGETLTGLQTLIGSIMATILSPIAILWTKGPHWIPQGFASYGNAIIIALNCLSNLVILLPLVVGLKQVILKSQNLEDVEKLAGIFGGYWFDLFKIAANPLILLTPTLTVFIPGFLSIPNRSWGAPDNDFICRVGAYVRLASLYIAVLGKNWIRSREKYQETNKWFFGISFILILGVPIYFIFSPTSPLRTSIQKASAAGREWPPKECVPFKRSKIFEVSKKNGSTTASLERYAGTWKYSSNPDYKILLYLKSDNRLYSRLKNWGGSGIEEEEAQVGWENNELLVRYRNSGFIKLSDKNAEGRLEYHYSGMETNVYVERER